MTLAYAILINQTIKTAYYESILQHIPRASKKKNRKV